MGCGVGRRHGSDLVLLWLWFGPTAVAPILPLAWELPYAVGVALKKQKKKPRRCSVQNKLFYVENIEICKNSSPR